MPRPIYKEAKSFVFYLTLAIFIVILATSLTLYFCGIISFPGKDIVSAVIGADSALLGFVITVLALYFTFGMKSEVKERLTKHGFYYMVPRDMVRAVVGYAGSLVLALVSYFTGDYVCGALIISSAIILLFSVTLTVIVTIRFFKIIRKNLTTRE